MPGTAYSYIRFSHPDQAKGDSLRRQTELRDAWLTRNKVTLDTSLTLEDKGVSGYTGQHRENPDRHALAAFVALVKKDRIAKGSYLIVENLDRLSRQDIIPALSLLLDLIQSGIRVVQLLPVEAVYDAKSNPMNLMMAIMELARGHSESQMKSERVGRAWRNKKKQAAENGEPVTARTPAWLRLRDGQFEVIAEAAEAVRQIYRWAIAGYGLGVITKKLNAAGTPPISTGKGRGKHWARSYVAKILANRAVMGEYQPYRGRGPKREPDGEPIPGYYPVIVSEQDWYAAKAALTGRKGKAGRLAKDRVNIFSGLLHDARDGGTIQIVNKGRKSHPPSLVSYKAVQGVRGSHYVSFPLAAFEEGVLSLLTEIDPREIMPSNGGADRTMELTGRIAEVEGQIEKLKVRLQARYSDAVADVLERHETEKKDFLAQLEQARQEAASPLAEAWGECRPLFQALRQAPDQEEARVRLRAALRRVLEAIWCLFIDRGTVRLAVVELRFKGGACRRFILYRKKAHGGLIAPHPAVEGLAFVPPDLIREGESLRQPEVVRRVEETLKHQEVVVANDLEKLAQYPGRFKQFVEEAQDHVRRLRGRKP